MKHILKMYILELESILVVKGERPLILILITTQIVKSLCLEGRRLWISIWEWGQGRRIAHSSHPHKWNQLLECTDNRQQTTTATRTQDSYYYLVVIHFTEHFYLLLLLPTTTTRCADLLNGVQSIVLIDFCDHRPKLYPTDSLDLVHIYSCVHRVTFKTFTIASRFFIDS